MILCDQFTYSGYRRSFHIRAHDLTTHAFVCGGSGVGKSSLVVNLLSELACEGGSFAFLDPHGTSADTLLDLLPRRRSRDVIYIRPRDLARPVGLNPLAGVAPDLRYLVASNVVEAFKNQYLDSWGPRLEWYLSNCVRTLLEIEGATLLWIPRLLVDWPWRRSLTSHLSPELQSFWLDEFEKKDKRLREEAISPIQNKIGPLVASPPLALALGQRESAFLPSAVMDERKILVIDLSGMGRAEADIYGSLLTTLFAVEAMKRTKADPFLLALDEAHRFSTSSLGSILSEGRKFGLGLLLVSQYLEQWDKDTRAAIFANASTTVTFRQSGTDAQMWEKHLGSDWPSAFLAELPPYHAVVRAMQNGEAVVPFHARTRPPKEKRGHRAGLVRASRERYGKHRDIIERAIRRELNE